MYREVEVTTTLPVFFKMKIVVLPVHPIVSVHSISML